MKSTKNKYKINKVTLRDGTTYYVVLFKELGLWDAIFGMWATLATKHPSLEDAKAHIQRHIELDDLNAQGEVISTQTVVK